jgi:succinoglycan biosynthesis transport protein ExoP
VTTQKTLRLQLPSLHWLSIVRILWKGKLTLVTIWVILSIVGVAIAHRRPLFYRAEALILVMGQRIPERYVTSTVNTAPEERLAAISQLILSNSRLQEIIDSFGLYQVERQVLSREALIKQMREVDINLKLESGLSNSHPDAFRISYQAKDPKIAADVVNRLAGLVIEENQNSREGHAEGTSDFIEDQLRLAKQTLDELESRVSHYKVTHMGELPQEEGSLNATLSRLQVQLQGDQDAMNRSQQSKLVIENTLNIAEASLGTLERAEKDAVEAANRRAAAEAEAQSSPIPVAAEPIPIPVIKPKTRRQALQEEIANLRLRYRDDHPEMRRLKAELARLPKDVDPDDSGNTVRPANETPQRTPVPRQTAAAAPPPVSPAIVAEKERIANLRFQLTVVAREFESAKAERDRVLAEIQTYQGRVSRIPFREQEMAALTRDYENAKGNYRSLVDKKMSAEMATDMEHRQQGEKFTLIDAARVPERPLTSRRAGYGVAVFLSAAISALIVLGRQLPKDTMLGEWELTPGVLVLGRVPRIDAPKARLAFVAPGRPAD